jgi:hypothetical protein
MVFYFTSNGMMILPMVNDYNIYSLSFKVVDPPAMIYMGKDKFESKFLLYSSTGSLKLGHQKDEYLIKYGWEEDVWFHVDKLSSAHVYLRLKEGESWENIPPALLDDLAQLTKANSIEGDSFQGDRFYRQSKFMLWNNRKQKG